jgi:hypothetical protein
VRARGNTYSEERGAKVVMQIYFVENQLFRYNSKKKDKKKCKNTCISHFDTRIFAESIVDKRITVDKAKLTLLRKKGRVPNRIPMPFQEPTCKKVIFNLMG